MPSSLPQRRHPRAGGDLPKRTFHRNHPAWTDPGLRRDDVGREMGSQLPSDTGLGPGSALRSGRDDKREARVFPASRNVILGLVPRIHRAAGASGTMDPRHGAEDDSFEGAGSARIPPRGIRAKERAACEGRLSAAGSSPGRRKRHRLLLERGIVGPCRVGSRRSSLASSSPCWARSSPTLSRADAAAIISSPAITALAAENSPNLFRTGGRLRASGVAGANSNGESRTQQHARARRPAPRRGVAVRQAKNPPPRKRSRWHHQ